MHGQTPSQTVGPFFAHALTPAAGNLAVAGNRLGDESTPGETIRIEGLVLDGEGSPVPDAMIEVWQADAAGRYPEGGAGFTGFGRAATDENGAYWFQTVKPGPVAAGSAPHVNVTVFARGMLNHAFTRIYFGDTGRANESDAVLASLPPARQRTLIAGRLEGDGCTCYQFTIRLQGEDETVFFDA